MYDGMYDGMYYDMYTVLVRAMISKRKRVPPRGCLWWAHVVQQGDGRFVSILHSCTKYVGHPRLYPRFELQKQELNFSFG